MCPCLIDRPSSFPPHLSSSLYPPFVILGVCWPSSPIQCGCTSERAITQGSLGWAGLLPACNREWEERRLSGEGDQSSSPLASLAVGPPAMTADRHDGPLTHCDRRNVELLLYKRTTEGLQPHQTKTWGGGRTFEIADVRYRTVFAQARHRANRRAPRRLFARKYQGVQILSIKLRRRTSQQIGKSPVLLSPKLAGGKQSVSKCRSSDSPRDLGRGSRQRGERERAALYGGSRS